MVCPPQCHSVHLLQELVYSPEVCRVNNPVGEVVTVTFFLEGVDLVLVEVQHIGNQPPDNLEGLGVVQLTHKGFYLFHK